MRRRSYGVLTLTLAAASCLAAGRPALAPPGRARVGAAPRKPAAAPLPSARPELEILSGHTSWVLSVALSPDGKTAASGGRDSTVRLWDLRTGECRRALAGHSGEVSSVAFSPDGKTLVSGSLNDAARVWDARSGELRRVLAGSLGAAAFSPDGRTIATGDANGALLLWDAATGALRRTLAGRGSILSAVALSSNGRFAATASVNDSVTRVWDLRAGKLQRTLRGRSPYVRAASFSPDSRTLATGDDRAVLLWDVSAGVLRRTLTGPAFYVQSLAFSADGKSLACGGWHDNGVLLWDLGDLEKDPARRVLAGHTAEIFSVAFGRDGTLASASGDGSVRLWAAGTLQTGRVLEGSKSGIRCVAWARGSGTVMTGSDDGLIREWDPSTGRLRRAIAAHTSWVRALALSPDGRRLVSAGDDGALRFQDARTAVQQRSVTDQKGRTFSAAYSPDGTLLATAGEDGAFLRDGETGAVRRSLPGHPSSVTAAVFSPSGDRLATACRDGRIRLWDARSGTLQHVSPAQGGDLWALAFSPDGKTLASGSGGWWQPGAVRLWDVETGKEQQALAAPAGIVGALIFSPDGRTLAGASYAGADRGIRLWDAASGQIRRILPGQGDWVRALAFSSGGETLAAGGMDGPLRLWQVESGRLLGTLLPLPSRTEEAAAEWLAVTPEGFYDGSPGAGRFIRWRVGRDVFPLEAYEHSFRRPALLGQALRGESIGAPATELRRFLAGSLLPPRVRFDHPRDGEEVSGSTARVEVTVTDDRGAARLETYVNGRRVDAKPIVVDARPIVVDAKPIIVDAKPIIVDAKPIAVDAKPLGRPARPAAPTRLILQRYVLSVPLPEGEERLVLRVVAHDEDGLQGWEERRVRHGSAAPEQGDLHVLAVGVSHYRDPSFDLRYAGRDAEAFVTLWKGAEGTSFRHVIATRLVDAEATAARVRAALSELAAAATPRDTVALFLSGHGLQVREGVFAFATFDIDPSTPARAAQTGLPWSVLDGTLAKLKARRVLLFLDACHSGGSLGGQAAGGERLGEILARHSGVLVFASSRDSECSYELEARQHGAFTAALEEGLGEGRADLEVGGERDGTITAEELLTYLRARVRQLTENRQTPTCPLLRDFGEALPLLTLSRR